MDNKELRNFALVTGAMFIVFFGLLLPWLWNAAFPAWPWILAIVLGLWGSLLPATLAPVHRVWMKLAHGLGWINTRIILSAVFFLLFFPFGVIMRLVAKDPMARCLDKDADSYRVRSALSPVKKMEQPF
jgi:hypothetical protein